MKSKRISIVRPNINILIDSFNTFDLFFLGSAFNEFFKIFLNNLLDWNFLNFFFWISFLLSTLSPGYHFVKRERRKRV